MIEICILNFDNEAHLGAIALFDERLATPSSGAAEMYPQHRVVLARISYDSPPRSEGWGVFTVYSDRNVSEEVFNRDVDAKYSSTYTTIDTAMADFTAYGAGFYLTGDVSRSFILSTRCDRGE